MLYSVDYKEHTVQHNLFSVVELIWNKATEVSCYGSSESFIADKHLASTASIT